MPKYTVTSPIKLESGRIEIGDTVDMSENDAKPLIALGALEAPAAKVAPGPKPPPRSAGQEVG